MTASRLATTDTVFLTSALQSAGTSCPQDMASDEELRGQQVKPHPPFREQPKRPFELRFKARIHEPWEIGGFVPEIFERSLSSLEVCEQRLAEG